MGRRALRDDELEFIEQTQRTDDVRRILRGPHGAQAAAAKRIEQLYFEQFSGLLSGETEAEYQARRKKNRKAVRLEDETEEQRAHRLKMAPSRILGVLKRGSENFSRRKQSRADDDSENEQRPSPVSLTKTNAYREFQSSQHPSKPKMTHGPDTPKSAAMREWNQNLKTAFDSLPAAEVAALQAKADAKKAEQETELAKEARRAKYVQDLPALTKRAAHEWQKEGGWVGMVMTGGIDQHGEIAALHRPTGRDGQGRTFEERLAEEFRCTPQYIEVLFMKWLCEIFDAPVPLEETQASQARTSLAAPGGEQGQAPEPVPSVGGVVTAPAVSHAGAVAVQPDAVSDRTMPAVEAIQPPAHNAGISPPRARTTSPPTTVGKARSEHGDHNDPRHGLANKHSTSSGKVATRPVVDDCTMDSDASVEFPGFAKLSEQVPRAKKVLVKQLQVSRPTTDTGKKSTGLPKAAKGAGSTKTKAVATKIKKRKSAAPTTAQGEDAHRSKSTPVSADAAATSHAATAAPADVAISPTGEEPLSTLPSATNVKKKTQKKPPTASAPGKAKVNTAKPVKAKATPKAADTAQPVETRTGRVVRRTARDQGVSPDMSAAKYARSRPPKVPEGGKRTRDDENTVIDERAHKKRR